MALAAAVWLLHEPVIAGLESHPYFRVTDLRVRSSGMFLSRGQVLDWLGIRAEANIWELQPRRVQARLERHPLVERAEVQRQFPSRLEIEVWERRPAAIVHLDRFYYVAEEGRVLLPLSDGHAADYPVITGPDADTAPGYRQWVLGHAMRVLRMCERVDCFGGLSEVHIDDDGVVLYPLAPRVEVRLGWGSWREKIRRARRILDAWGERAALLAHVDTRFRNQVVVGLREGVSPRPHAAGEEARGA